MLFDTLKRFKDILNCELVINESDESRDYTKKDLVNFLLKHNFVSFYCITWQVMFSTGFFQVFAISAFSRYLQNNPTKYFQLERIQDIFMCINSHSLKLLSDSEVVRDFSFILKYFKT